MKSEILEAVLQHIDGEGNPEVPLLLHKNSNDDWNKNFILVYGSLRKDQYNYERIRTIFGKSEFVFIEEMSLIQNSLYDLGQYPVAISDTSVKEVVCELMYCSNRVYEAIEQMETESGYRKNRGLVWIRIPTGVATRLSSMWINYFVADTGLKAHILANPIKFPRIESGDWVNWITGVKEIKEEEMNYYD